MSVQLLFFL